MFLFLVTGCDEEHSEPVDVAAQGSPLHLMFATDSHYLSHALDEENSILIDVIVGSDGKMVHFSPEITQAFMWQVLQENPDALISGGDLTFNGEKQSHEELASLLQPIKDAGIPVLIVPGNHDINQPEAYKI